MRAGWEYKKLGEVCNITSGFTPKTSELSPLGKYPYFKVAEMNMSGNEVYMSVTPSYVDNSKKFYPSQSIVFPKNGAAIATNKKRILAQDSIVDLNTAVATFSEELIPKYSYYWLVNIDFRDYTRGGALPTLDLKLLKDTIFPLPPIPQQRLIVSELDEINSLIALKREQLKKYDELAQSLFYEMFGDPVENEKGWVVKKLNEIAIKIGSGATPRGGNNSYKEEGICFIRSMNVHNNRFIYEDLAHIDEIQAKSLSNVEIKRQDVLLNITGASVARCCLVPDDVLPARVNQHVCIIRVKNSIVLSTYINRLLTNENYQKTLLSLSRSKAATREALPKSIVDKLSIPLPPLSLQQLFAQRIEQIEEQKKQISAVIAQLETLLASRMQYWFE